MTFFTNCFGGCLIYCALHWPADAELKTLDRKTMVWAGVILLLTPVILKTVLPQRFRRL